MVVHPASGRVIVGGQMSTINGTTELGMGSLDGVTGAAGAVGREHRRPELRQQCGDLGPDDRRREDLRNRLGVLRQDGATANFEGVFAADPLTGAIDWVDGGRGDNYGIAVGGEVLYHVGHPHDWGMLDWNPQYTPDKFQHATAIDKQRSPTLTNAFGTTTQTLAEPFNPGRRSRAGRAQPLHWLPTLTGGTYTGQSQAAWSVATQRELRRARRRVPEGQRHEPAGSRAVREAHDRRLDRRRGPGLQRADARR